MGSEIFEIQPPRWLQAATRPLDMQAIGQTATGLMGGLVNSAIQGKPIGESISDSFMALKDPLWDVHKQEANLALESGKMALDFQRQKISDVRTDQSTGADWWSKYQTPEERLNAPEPAFKTAEAWRSFNMARANDVKLITAKSRDAGSIAAITSFKNRVDALSKIDPESAGPFLPSVGKVPSDTIQQALSIALAAAQQHQKNVATQAEIEAKARGDVPTTTISDKGVTTTFRPPTAAQISEEYSTPVIKEFGKQKFLFWRNYMKELDSRTSKDVERLSNKVSDARIKLKTAQAGGEPSTINVAQATYDATVSELEGLSGVTTSLSPPPSTNAPSKFEYKIIERQ